MAKGVELAFARKLGERSRLVITALGKPCERFRSEDVYAAADPVVQKGRFAKTRHDLVPGKLDDAERRTDSGDGDGRCPVPLVMPT